MSCVDMADSVITVANQLCTPFANLIFDDQGLPIRMKVISNEI